MVSKYIGYQLKNKGSYDKWYPRWSASALEDHKGKSAIEKLFVEKVDCELCEELLASGVARPRAHSDGSNSSELSKANLDVSGLAERLNSIRSNSGFFLAKNRG